MHNAMAVEQNAASNGDSASKEARFLRVKRRVLKIRIILLFEVLFAGLGVCVVLFGWLYFLPLERDVTLSNINAMRLEVRNAAPVPQDAPASAASFLSLSTTFTTSAISSTSVSAAATATTTGVTKVFQVDGPVLGPQGVIMSDGEVVNEMGLTGLGGTSCTVTLMEFEFKDSFGKPFVGDYTPPACVNGSNSAMMNFTVLSKGTQFDRLAIMYLGDSEVFRTSTAEPRRSGISWEYLKDMSHFMYYWKTPQKVIFDLPNQTTATLTGTYNATLTVTFFTAKQSVEAADMIIPISARQGQNASQPSVFAVPAANASNTITNFPRNANKAVVSISSTGQGNEEFWWSNALQSDALTYNATGGTIFGFSPFREVQLYVDGMLAGVQWPFPVVFTGGVVPAFWSPVVGIDAFDLKEYQIDITPWLPMLCDGQAHTFTMKVAGLNDNGANSATLSESVGNNWQLTGKIFIWLDDEGKITTGTAPSVSSSPPNITVSQSITKNGTGSNDTLTYSTSIQRRIQISSSITTQSGTLVVSWTQVLNHTDLGAFLNFGNIQSNIITTTGMDTSIRGAATGYTNTYSYPLFANSTGTQFPNGSTSFVATLSRSKSISVLGTSIYPSGLQPFAALPQSAQLVLTLAGTTYVNTQVGNATLFLTPGSGNGSFSVGETDQTVRFGGRSAQGELGMEPDIELYFRRVGAANGSVTTDVERLVGKGVVRSAGDGALGGGNASVSVVAETVVGRQQQQQLLLPANGAL